jgi:large subunit ribosomal protein L15
MSGIEISVHPSNTKKRKRKGRGISSGHGKTCGRGQTGQKSRSGGTPAAHFEGGMNPLVRHFPKIGGFKHYSKIIYFPVNLNQLSAAESGTVIDLAWLAENGLLPSKTRGIHVKLLGDGELKTKLTFRLHAFSNSAKAKVEKAGGSCEVAK